jgi:hypothetical protein
MRPLKKPLLPASRPFKLRLMLLGLKRFTKMEPYNLKEARRKIAGYITEKGEYPF